MSNLATDRPVKEKYIPPTITYLEEAIRSTPQVPVIDSNKISRGIHAVIPMPNGPPMKIFTEAVTVMNAHRYSFISIPGPEKTQVRLGPGDRTVLPKELLKNSKIVDYIGRNILKVVN